MNHPSALARPKWLTKTYRKDPNRALVDSILGELSLNTVCHEADCPNHLECFAQKTATFMILGTRCTRNCRFCNVTHRAPQPVEPGEPERVAEAVRRLGLRYVVITSVTRDDLPDGGSAHFAETIRQIRLASPGTAVEVLIPDFKGDPEALGRVAEAKPAVISHNMETVRSLYSAVRPQADYLQSLTLLRRIHALDPGIRSKTGIMLGLGETEAEVLELFDHLRAHDCDFLTIGQYLAPSREHYPVREYPHPDVFEAYRQKALAAGFSFVASAPFVRSSFMAGEALGAL